VIVGHRNHMIDSVPVPLPVSTRRNVTCVGRALQLPDALSPPGRKLVTTQDLSARGSGLQWESGCSGCYFRCSVQTRSFTDTTRSAPTHTSYVLSRDEHVHSVRANTCATFMVAGELARFDVEHCETALRWFEQQIRPCRHVFFPSKAQVR
jgi:hypothetical protein